ncbi:MAG: hypothetical protein K1X35_09895 [Caulobacteraceae bacterium]|nr:hypothetical protein [Caulobacteraceae bacterium]
MSPALIWRLLTARMAGPITALVAVVLAVLLAAAAAEGALERHRSARLAQERDAWRTSTARWRAAHDAIAGVRRRERSVSEIAAKAAEASCLKRVETARRSARAIRSILQEEVTHEANGCPVRRLVPAERLRDALAAGG